MFKGIVDLISSNPSFKEGHARLKKFPLKPLVINLEKNVIFYLKKVTPERSAIVPK